MAGFPCCCGEDCADCGNCGTMQDDIQVALAGFTNVPDGNYVASCVPDTACLWVHTFAAPNVCGAKTIRVFLEATRWLVRLEETIPFPPTIYAAAQLSIGSAPHDCQPSALDIPVFSNTCGGVSPTMELTSV